MSEFARLVVAIVTGWHVRISRKRENALPTELKVF